MTRLSDVLDEALGHLAALRHAYINAQALLVGSTNWPVPGRLDNAMAIALLNGDAIPGAQILTRRARIQHPPTPRLNSDLAELWVKSQLRLANAHHAIRRLGAEDGWRPCGPLTTPVLLPVILDAVDHATIAVRWLNTAEQEGRIPGAAAGDAFKLCHQVAAAVDVWPVGFRIPAGAKHPAQKTIRICGCGKIATRKDCCEACYQSRYRTRKKEAA